MSKKNLLNKQQNFTQMDYSMANQKKKTDTKKKSYLSTSKIYTGIKYFESYRIMKHVWEPAAWKGSAFHENAESEKL